MVNYRFNKEFFFFQQADSNKVTKDSKEQMLSSKLFAI